MSDPVSIRLGAPIQAHGQSLSELRLRPLIAGDLRRHGIPFSLRQSAGAVCEDINAATVAALIGELAGIPVSSVDQLLPVDFLEALTVIRGFLLATTPAGSSPPPGA